MHQTSSGQVLIPLSKFAEANALSRSYIYKLIARGEGPRTVTVGRRRMVTTRDAEAWATSLEQRADQGAAA